LISFFIVAVGHWHCVDKILWFDGFGYAWHFRLSGLAHTGPDSTLANRCPEITRNFIL